MVTPVQNIKCLADLTCAVVWKKKEIPEYVYQDPWMWYLRNPRLTHLAVVPKDLSSPFFSAVEQLLMPMVAGIVSVESETFTLWFAFSPEDPEEEAVKAFIKEHTPYSEKPRQRLYVVVDNGDMAWTIDEASAHFYYMFRSQKTRDKLCIWSRKEGVWKKIYSNERD